MAGKIILHLGLHKTATTSLQDFLQAHARVLAGNGVRYVPRQRMRTDLTPLFLNLDRGRRARLTLFIEEVERDTLLLSDENIIGSPSEIAEGALYPYARNRIESFCEENAGKEIIIFLTLRDPSRFLLSMYSEYLRHNEFAPFDKYVGSINLRAFSYRKIFGWMRKLPSNTSVRFLPFEAAHGGGVVPITRALIEEACGTESCVDPETFPTTKSRTAYMWEELELGAEIARRAGPLVAQGFLNMLDNRGRRFGTTVFEPLPAKVVSALSERYLKDLSFLRT
jgi:hypothetical protein